MLKKRVPASHFGKTLSPIKFVKENIALLIMIPAAIMAVIATVLLVPLVFDSGGESAPPVGYETISVLPDMGSAYRQREVNDPFTDADRDILSSVELAGIVTGEDGFSMAILSIDGSSLVAGTDQQLFDGRLSITEIGENYVTVTAGDKSRQINIPDESNSNAG